MNLLMILRNMKRKYEKNNQTLFATDVRILKQILEEFPEPEDLYERSYFQYDCQMKLLPGIVVLLQNIAASILLPLYYLMLTIVKYDTPKHIGDSCAVFFTDGVSIKMIPECLRTEYCAIVPSGFANEMIIGEQEKVILRIIFYRYWYSPYFVFKCMIKIGMYAAKIKNFSPKAIISYTEYSYTSSVLTEYCRSCKVEHINIMHGEKLFNIYDAFVQYDRFYVWDQHYINLFSDLRAKKEQFRIAIPYIIKEEFISTQKPIYEYTYYLGGEVTAELRAIRDVLLRIGAPLSCVCIRYHPRYSDENEIMSIYQGFQIENPNEVSLNESFAKTKYVVAFYSTVLFQAYLSGKEVVIDDMTNAVNYKKMKELNYLMLEKPHLKLSEIV